MLILEHTSIRRSYGHDDGTEWVSTMSMISQYLAILRDKGILASRKDANRVYYRVGDARTLRLIGLMREVFCARQPSHSSPT